MTTQDNPEQETHEGELKYPNDANDQATFQEPAHLARSFSTPPDGD
jgi:hypothetical protein